MTQATVRINEQGRLVVPAQLRRELELVPGSSLVAYVEDGRLILEDRDHLAARLQHEAIQARTDHGSVVDELINDRRAEAATEQDDSDRDR